MSLSSLRALTTRYSVTIDPTEIQSIRSRQLSSQFLFPSFPQNFNPNNPLFFDVKGRSEFFYRVDYNYIYDKFQATFVEFSFHSYNFLLHSCYKRRNVAIRSMSLTVIGAILSKVRSLSCCDIL